MDVLSQLNFREIELFVLACQTRSLRETARQCGLQPAHVSKVIKSLERKLGQSLFRRTSFGIAPSPEGLALLNPANEICEISRTFLNRVAKSHRKEKLWTVGSISFLATYLLAPRVQYWRGSERNLRFRFIEFTHNDLVSHGLKGAFELAVHIEPLEWTSIWKTYSLGSMQWKLYGSCNHPLSGSCAELDALRFPFIVPTDWGSNGYSMGEDFCPLSVLQRKKGDEAATAETALELCSYSDQLTFVPEILARRWVKAGQLKVIQVKDWSNVEKKIFLSVKSDVVPRKLVESILGKNSNPQVQCTSN